MGGEITIGVGLLVFLVVNVATVVGSHVRLATQLMDFKQDNDRRLTQIEKTIGLENGNQDSRFMSRGECEAVHTGNQRVLFELDRRVTRLEDRHP